MFKRIRQLRISLAAKCQILFGAAVVLIIAAALFVPWQRMEQLTEQLNERAAGALADEAVDRHIASTATTTAPERPRRRRPTPADHAADDRRRRSTPQRPSDAAR